VIKTFGRLAMLLWSSNRSKVLELMGSSTPDVGILIIRCRVTHG
jgi:hypothetical protein